MVTSNGAYAGFPQTTWNATQAKAKFFGSTDTRLLHHKSKLSEFIEKTNEMRNICAIAKGLIESNLPLNDPLITNCQNKIRNLLKNNKGMNLNLNSEITLRVLLVFFCDQDEFVKKLKGA